MRHWHLEFVGILALLGCVQGTIAGRVPVEGGASCVPVATLEIACSDGVDDDCDTFTDCADVECAGAACADGGYTCISGGCALAGVLPDLPPLVGVTTNVRGDTLQVTFSPEAGARDYRIYQFPDPSAVTANIDGSITVQDAIYRCAGDRPLPQHVGTLSGDLLGYNRSIDEALLGYVYLTPATGRVPVYALGDPSPTADSIEGTHFVNTRLHLYTTDGSQHDALVAAGWRDVGIAFYVPASAGDVMLHRYVSAPQPAVQNIVFTLINHNGPEQDRRAADGAGHVTNMFAILSAPTPDTVPLYRVLWWPHDELAPGEALRDRLVSQGNQPVTALTWSGLTARTTLVLEALDRGCPFYGLLAAHDTEAVGYAKASASLATARAADPNGEVWVNGQFAPNGNPIPIARSFVTATPASPPPMDFFADFQTTGVNQSFTVLHEDGGVGRVHLASELFDLEFYNIERPSRSFGEVLGEWWLGFADTGADTNGQTRLAPKQMAHLTDDAFVHATMEVDIPSTLRRYPQMMISTLTPPVRPSLANGTTIVVQPFGDKTRLELQYCDHRVWNVNNQCPRARFNRDLSIQGYNDRTTPWTPMPVVAEYAGFDRRAQIDVYASTTRVYVFFEGRPYGCGILPDGIWSEGDVSVSFGAVLYHSGVDESVICDNCPHEYLKRYRLTQALNHFDNLGFKSGANLPAWDHGVMPCADSNEWF